MNFTPTLVSIFALLAPASQDQLTTYNLANGRSVRAQVIEVNWDNQQAHMRGIVDGQTKEGWVPLDTFSHRSAIRILKAVMDPNDPITYLHAAKYSADHSELAEAHLLVNQAQALPAYANLPADIKARVAEGVSTVLEQEFHDALFAGDFTKTEKILEELQKKYPETKAGKKVPKLKELQDQKKAAATQHAEEVKAMETSERAKKEVDRHIKPIERNIELGKQASTQGMNDSKHFSKAKKYFGTAVRYFDSALRSVDHLLKKYGNDPDASQRLGALKDDATSSKKGALLNAARLAEAQTDYHSAMGYVNAVLAFLPDDAEAKSLQSQISTAASRSGWGWRSW